MKKTITVLCVLFGLCGCLGSALCPAVNSVSDKVALVLQEQCGCDYQAVRADVYSLLNVGSMCPAMAGGAIAQTICPIAGNLVVGMLADLAANSKYKCTKAAACMGSIEAVAVAGCEALPFAPQDVK